MQFPDCRLDETYNEDFLDKDRASFVEGADWMLEQIINLFENNLITYRGRLEYDGDVDIDKVLDKAKSEICEMIEDWAEMERNMLITAFIEGMDDDEYETCKQKALEENEMSEEPKHYRDTRFV